MASVFSYYLFSIPYYLIFPQGGIRGGLFLFLITNIHASNLAAYSLRQFIGKLDDTWVFVWSCLLLYVILQFFDEVFARFILVFRSQNHCGFDYLTADFIRDRGDGTLHHCRMSHQGRLHFEWSDTVTRGLDNIVRTGDKPEIIVFIAIYDVASVVITVFDALGSEVIVAIIALEKSERTLLADLDDEFAMLHWLGWLALIVEYVNVKLGCSHSHCTWLRSNPRE